MQENLKIELLQKIQFLLTLDVPNCIENDIELSNLALEHLSDLRLTTENLHKSLNFAPFNKLLERAVGFNLIGF